MRMVLVFQYRLTYFFVGDLLAHGVQYFTSLLCWLPDACLSRHSIISTPNQVFFYAGDFVIYLNNSHPVIQEQLRQKLNECEQLMEQGKNFALEVFLLPPACFAVIYGYSENVSCISPTIEWAHYFLSVLGSTV